ncbi:MAG: chromosomal replication initiator protein DnaA [Bacteroidales bacterium]|jgi:chromosomal replication initiator protein|nr:chromosomal replication initiator protein DnaA [Bacteroidales bacterium]
MHHQVWNKCLSIFRDNLEKSQFENFFEPIKPIKFEQEILTVQVPSLFYYEYLEEHYIDLLRKTIRRVIGSGARLEYSIPVGANPMVMPANEQKVITNPPISISMTGPKNPYAEPGIAGIDRHIHIDPRLKADFTFANFVEGDCNRLARSAGLAIAEKPGGTAFNPFFIYGKSGLGKTHLAQAIGIRVKEENPRKTVLYVNASMFTTQFVDASQNKNINNFLNFYQCIDLLIIDDVQEFESKPKTQRTFFDIFNHLHQRNKQLILTSDRPPVELQGLITERLLSRFKWGLSTELQLPDYATRLKILKQRAYRDGIELPEDVLEYTAKKIVDNVRELEGVLIGLLAQATLNKKAITLELAQFTIEKLIKHSRPEISIDYIRQVVSDYYRLDEDHLLSNTRKREIVQARQVAMYLSKQFTKTSLKNIGAQLGNKDHATVLHACRTVNNLIETDRHFKTQIEELEGKFGNG